MTSRLLLVASIVAACGLLATPAAAQTCADLANSPLAEPPWYAAQCLGQSASATAGDATTTLLAPTDTAFSQDIGFVSDNFFTHEQGDLTASTVLNAAQTALYFGMDFDPTATELFALDFNAVQLVQVDLADGSSTAIGPLTLGAGETPSGLTSNPTTGDWFVSGTDGSVSNLYSIDISTGATTLIGPVGVAILIDIAMNCQGELYGHDIDTDTIISIDPTTGAGVSVGATGVDSNFAQGMDFDNDTGELYVYAYTGGGNNTYGTADLSTGAVTAINTNDPLGEFEGASQTTCPTQATTLTLAVASVQPSSPGEMVDFDYFLEVDADRGVPPTGNVTVEVAGGPSCTAPVGDEACSVVINAPGTYLATATYEGDAVYGPATSNTVTVQVQRSITEVPLPHAAWILGIVLAALAVLRLRLN